VVRCDECREPIGEAEVEDALAETGYAGFRAEDLRYVTIICGDCSGNGRAEAQ